MKERIIESASHAIFGNPLVVNSHRGLLVEAIVADALGNDWKWVSEDWAAWDFEHSTGLRLEVKQSAALQTWYKTGIKTAQPRFDCASRTGRWDGSKWLPIPGRFADIYIFAYHPETDVKRADHRDPLQWRFIVVLEKMLPDQKTMALSKVEQLGAAVTFQNLRDTVSELAKKA